MELRMLIVIWGQAFLFVRKGIVSAVKREEFINDRMANITIRSRWCDIVVLHMHAPTEDKSDDMKESF
jgi:hypothetical protein